MAREQTFITFSIESPRMTAADIEQKLGLKPDVSWLAGAARGAFGAKAKNHGFVLETTAGPSEPFANHMREMLKRLTPYAQKIGALGAELDIEFACSLHRKQAPVVEFTRDELRWLGVMGARLKVDIQIISDQPRGPQPPQPGGAAAKPPAF